MMLGIPRKLKSERKSQSAVLKGGLEVDSLLLSPVITEFFLS